MNLFVLSDLHIWGSDDPLYTSLLSVLRDRVQSGDRVVLAGDIFDLFVGNKRLFKQRYSDFLQAMSDACAKGAKIHYIEGNHDFLLKNAFRKIDGVQVHPLDVKLELEGRNFYFAHGDTADQGDYSYRFLRTFLEVLL